MTWILPKQLHTLACALDTEALSLGSNEQSQVCAQSVFVRSKPSPSAIWLQKWKRDSWTRHLYGRILKPSLGQRFATEWTSSLGATHASPSVQQASGSEVKTPGISGRISQEAFQFFNQESASLKTSRATLPVGCITYCATWEDWVTEQRGAYSARLNAVRLTNASGCSSWPSPVASEVRQGFQDRSRGMKGSQESLTTVVVKQHGRPVPVSSSTDGSRPEWLQISKLGGGKSWMTPRTQMTRDGNQRWEEEEETLGGKIKWIPAHSNIEEQMAVIGETKNAKLNPRWVETLMGLPVGWTMPSCASPVTIERMSSDSSVTVLSQQQQNEPSEA